MITVTLEVNGRAFQQFVDDVSELPRRFIDTLESEVVPRAQVRFDRRLNPEPGPVKLPFQFASDASRVFYLVAARKGQLPNVGPDGYRRTGAARRFKVEGRLVHAGLYEVWLTNPTPHAVWTFGPRQVPGHVNTGWPNVYLTLAEERGPVAADALAAFGSTFKGGLRGGTNS